MIEKHQVFGVIGGHGCSLGFAEIHMVQVGRRFVVEQELESTPPPGNKTSPD